MLDEYHIVACQVQPNYNLMLTFADGKEGVVNLKHLVGSGVFASWKNYEEFQKAEIDPISQTVSWGSNIDLDPVMLRKSITK